MTRFPNSLHGLTLGDTVELTGGNAHTTLPIGTRLVVDEIDTFFGDDEATIFCLDANDKRHELYPSLGETLKVLSFRPVA